MTDPHPPAGQRHLPVRRFAPGAALRRLASGFYHGVILTEQPALQRFFGKRCTHLAGMIAYFGLLSVVPAVLLAVSALGSTGELSQQGWLLGQIRHAVPSDAFSTVSSTVRYLRHRSGSFGVIGAIGLIYTTTNFLSCIESALNIIYDVDNRHFVFQKLWVLVLMIVGLGVLLASAATLSLVLPLLSRHTTVLHLGGAGEAVTLAGSMLVSFVALCVTYRFLLNDEIHLRQVWRGALMASLLLTITFHYLPLYLDQSHFTPVIKAFAGAAVVLISLYLLGVILLAGAVFNWWWARRGTFTARGDLLRPLSGAD